MKPHTGITKLLVVAALAAAGLAAPAGADQVVNDSTVRAGVTSANAIYRVETTFKEPKIHCRKIPDASMRIQVVLGRPEYGDQTSIGTQAGCKHGKASYFLWHQWVGGTRELVAPIPKGIRVRLDMWARSGSVLGSYTLLCEGGQYCGGGSFSGPTSQGYSTGAITVHTSARHGVVQPVPDFGTIYFVKPRMNDAPVGADGTMLWQLVGATGNVLAIPSGVHPNGTFSISWRASS